MKKAKISGIIASLIFIVAFNAIFFIVAGFDHPASVWIAYAMIHVSYIMLILTPVLAGGGKTVLETSTPLFMLSGINFGVHFLVGLIFMLVAPDGCTFEIILYIILLVAYLIPFFTLFGVNAHTTESAKRQAKEVFFIKNQASKVKMLVGRAQDAELAKLLEIASDNMHASPSRSSENAAMIESSITMKVCEIGMAMDEDRIDDAKKTCRELGYLIEERNRILSLGY